MEITARYTHELKDGKLTVNVLESNIAKDSHMIKISFESVIDGSWHEATYKYDELRTICQSFADPTALHDTLEKMPRLSARDEPVAAHFAVAGGRKKSCDVTFYLAKVNQPIVMQLKAENVKLRQKITDLEQDAMKRDAVMNDVVARLNDASRILGDTSRIIGALEITNFLLEERVSALENKPDVSAAQLLAEIYDEGLHIRPIMIEVPRICDVSPRMRNPSPRMRDASPRMLNASPRMRDPSPRMRDASPGIM